MTAEKLQKLWNLATRNPNENEALVAARKFIRAINREQVSVHLYKGSPPASQEDIQRAINNAYQKGINDTKAEYQRQLDLNLNAKYNEGYLDGQRNAYTEDDMRRQYQKGYTAGQKSKSIKKAEPSDIVQDKQHTQTLDIGNGGTSTGTIFFHNQSSGTLHIRQN